MDSWGIQRWLRGNTILVSERASEWHYARYWMGENVIYRHVKMNQEDCIFWGVIFKRVSIDSESVGSGIRCVRSMRSWDKYEFGVINYIAVVIGNGAKCMHVLWCISWFEIRVEIGISWDPRYMSYGWRWAFRGYIVAPGFMLRSELFRWWKVLMYSLLIGSKYSGKVTWGGDAN